MGSSFNNTSNDHQEAVSLDSLRGQAMKRLAGIQQSLESKGVGDTFLRTAKADPIGDMGCVGSLIVDMIMCGSISAFMSAGVTGAFNGVSAAAGVEGAAVLADQKAHGYRGRALSDYPEGRRKCALEAARVGKKFNLVSANQNNQFSYDVQADLACMFEILDMLDKLEDAGVKTIRLDQKKPVYAALKQTSKNMFGNGAVRSYSMPMRMSV